MGFRNDDQAYFALKKTAEEKNKRKEIKPLNLEITQFLNDMLYVERNFKQYLKDKLSVEKMYLCDDWEKKESKIPFRSKIILRDTSFSKTRIISVLKKINDLIDATDTNRLSDDVKSLLTNLKRLTLISLNGIERKHKISELINEFKNLEFYINKKHLETLKIHLPKLYEFL